MDYGFENFQIECILSFSKLVLTLQCEGQLNCMVAHIPSFLLRIQTYWSVKYCRRIANCNHLFSGIALAKWESAFNFHNEMAIWNGTFDIHA